MSGQDPRLHWTQRVALVRHNLHSARRTNDFSFFKSLQAHALIEGTDHVALLYTALGDDADSVLSTLDNLNAGIAYVHQDAFKAVYDGAKSTMHASGQSLADRRSLVRVDVCQQRDMADHAIDKTANSAINYIEAQPVHCQEVVANAWITGTTIIADAVSVCLNEMALLEDNLDDFIRLEYSWNCIQSSVDSAISALRGIFSLMAAPNTNTITVNIPTPPQQGLFGRNLSVSSISGGSDHGGAASTRSRNSSTASAFSLIKRAFSHGQIQPPPTVKNARSGSIAMPVPEANARGFRASMSASCPTKIPIFGDHPHTILTTIPPTPAVESVGGEGGLLSPFKDSNDYFAFGEVDKGNKTGATEDLMQIEDLDPLYSPMLDEVGKPPGPSRLRRMSQSYDIGTAAPIAV